MSCEICKRDWCAPYMHSDEDQAKLEGVSELSEDQLRMELVRAKRNVKGLNVELEGLKTKIEVLEATIDELKDPCTN